MNRVRIPRHTPPQWPRWVQRMARALHRARLRVRIAQLRELVARPDLLDTDNPVEVALVEARLAELRCELSTLEMQR